MENLTQKYKFKIKYDQFGNLVDEDFFDTSEYSLIIEFEKAVLEYDKIFNKKKYTMIELGSNQAYYSCLFKSILGKDRTENVMVEPTNNYMERGKINFKINNYNGIFLDYSIGNNWGENGKYGTFEDKSKTLKEIMEEVKIKNLDFLHCDIDESEYVMLQTSKDIFINKNIKYIFLLTHTKTLTNDCKTFLLNCGYTCYFEDNNVGSDTLLIFKT